MNGFTLLWSKTLTSTIWMESKETRLLWFTMLMMKDSDGIVRSSKPGLAHTARLTDAECEEGLQVLMTPDKDSQTKTDKGRRIKEVPGGWLILNHDLYRFSTEAKREFWRQQKGEQRAKAENDKKKRKSERGPRWAGAGSNRIKIPPNDGLNGPVPPSSENTERADLEKLRNDLMG
jgi:hypothetical protein